MDESAGAPSGASLWAVVGASHLELPAAGELVADKYEVLRVLGAGGMGVVVAARHRTLGQLVALKLLSPGAVQSPEARERFLREARLAVAFKSEHVARVIDVGTLAGGAPYIVMEYLEGCDLRSLSDREGPLAPAVAVDYLLQACEAIAEAHSLGVVHRDLKPANLFLTRRADGSPLVKVLDFGISKTLAGRSSDPSLTRTDAVMGSPAYMAPEQIRSSKHVDHRVDIWALGVVLYELCAGCPPFDGDNLATLSAQICMDPSIPLRSKRPDVPEELARVVETCLAKDPAERHRDVGELARALLPFAPESARSLVQRIGRLCRSIAYDETLAVERAPSPTGDTVGATSATLTGTRSGRERSVRTALLVAIGVLAVAGFTALFVQPSEMPEASGARAEAPAELRTEPVASQSQVLPVPSASFAAPPPSAAPSAVPRTHRRSQTRAPKPAATPSCPVGLVWQGSRCERPLATSF